MAKAKSSGKTPVAEKKEGVAAVNRALAVLSAFETTEDGLSLSMLAEETGLYESTVLRILDSLILGGYVKRLADSRYVVGPKVLILSEMYLRSFKLEDYVLPSLRQLVAESGECAGLYVREIDQRVCLHQVQPPRSVRMHVVQGKAFPLTVGAAGHVILAIDEGTRGQRYDLIREHGFCVTKAERDPESAAIACPVFMRGSKLLGAISLVIPLYRCSDELVARLIPIVRKAAWELSNNLGGVSPYKP
jgi:DNA-binding IclR family transcriptional regulator